MICAELSGCSREQGREIATAIDALTDGLWLRAHLSQDWRGAEQPLRMTARAVARLLPRAGARVAELFGRRRA